jgi:hypothetical protein
MRAYFLGETSRGGLLRVVYKGLYANHRSEGGARLQRTVLRPESEVARAKTLAARAGGCARASRHRRDGSTAQCTIEPDLRVMARRPRRRRSNPFLGRPLLDPPSCTKLWGRWWAKFPSLSGAVTAALARRAPSSPICELGRCGQRRHRLVKMVAHIVLPHRLAPRSALPQANKGSSPMAPRTSCIDAPSLRGSASETSRSLR